MNVGLTRLDSDTVVIGTELKFSRCLYVINKAQMGTPSIPINCLVMMCPDTNEYHAYAVNTQLRLQTLIPKSHLLLSCSNRLITLVVMYCPLQNEFSDQDYQDICKDVLDDREWHRLFSSQVEPSQCLEEFHFLLIDDENL
eukprot:GILJ01003466.1.p1 GENE.GILJ01003466.1~~GILJ01003466.1.p1  ORF type:complete len:141 (+),score=6.51 GILJ01003466.1:48-470(+)